MARVKVRVLLASLGLAAALTTAFAAQAMAQYPPVRGSVVLAAGDGTPVVGGETTVSATVVDEQGDSVSGLACTFSVTQQPGNDASVDRGPFITDAAGRVSTTLSVGSTAGTIVVGADCGELTAAVTVVAGAAEAPAAPPASFPDTGSGSGTSGAGLTVWVLVGATALAGVSGLALAWRRRRA